MAKLDDRGLSRSTASDRAAEAYTEGLALLSFAWPGASQRLDAALEADPQFVLAHAALARDALWRGRLAA